MRVEDLLRYHVVVGKFLTTHLTSPQSLGTLQGAAPECQGYDQSERRRKTSYNKRGRIEIDSMKLEWHSFWAWLCNPGASAAQRNV